MTITIKQCCKVLDRAGVKYRQNGSYLHIIYEGFRYLISPNREDCISISLIDKGLIEVQSFKFNTLQYDSGNLYFSYKWQEPLVVKIK